jgi:BolA protein
MNQNLKDKMTERLHQEFQIQHLEVVDESWQHGGGPQAQSHFKITIVSEQFKEMKLLARHRRVQSTLAEIISQVRAISLHTLTPTEWAQAQAGNVHFRSPGCHNQKE